MKFSYMLLLSLCGVSLQVDAQVDPIVKLKKGQPEDVVKMIDRYVRCKHWSGEEPYDEERRREIDTAISSLRCDALAQDEKVILHKYSNDHLVLKVLVKAKDLNY